MVDCSANFAGKCSHCNTKYAKGVTIFKMNADTDLPQWWCPFETCPKMHEGSKVTKTAPEEEPTQVDEVPKVENPAELEKIAKEVIQEYDDAMKELEPATIRKSRASWVVALHDAQKVHPGTSFDEMKSKYILAQVFYKGLMGVN